MWSDVNPNPHACLIGLQCPGCGATAIRASAALVTQLLEASPLGDGLRVNRDLEARVGELEQQNAELTERIVVLVAGEQARAVAARDELLVAMAMLERERDAALAQRDELELVLRTRTAERDDAIRERDLARSLHATTSEVAAAHARLETDHADELELEAALVALEPDHHERLELEAAQRELEAAQRQLDPTRSGGRW